MAMGERMVCASMEHIGWSSEVAAGASGVLRERQIVLLPGGGKQGVPTIGPLWHLWQRSQLKHLLPASLHLQQVWTSVLHFASLVQQKHDEKDSLWQ